MAVQILINALLLRSVRLEDLLARAEDRIPLSYALVAGEAGIKERVPRGLDRPIERERYLVLFMLLEF